MTAIGAFRLLENKIGPALEGKHSTQVPSPITPSHASMLDTTHEGTHYISTCYIGY